MRQPGFLARDGFYKAKIEEVAREAGVAHGTVYLYFKNKEDLIISIFQSNLRELIQYINTEIQKEKGTEAMLRRLIFLQIELIEKNPDLTSLLLVEFPQTGKFLNSQAIEEVSAYIDMIAALLKQGIDEGVFGSHIDTNITATLIYSGIQGIATRWIMEEKRYSLKEIAGEISEVFLRGIKPKLEEN
ncbi:TetR/AcrR family transcriptional regulator [Candidatus Poribacteria bacterium]|nr:TetR/AcrR family transcriptional regulator [Candidatus Poribacteria bacterium]